MTPIYRTIVFQSVGIWDSPAALSDLAAEPRKRTRVSPEGRPRLSNPNWDVVVTKCGEAWWLIPDWFDFVRGI